jgi:hypothetical protein
MRKWIMLVLAALMVVFLAQQALLLVASDPVSAATGALLREHYNTGDNSGEDIWPDKQRAQTFTPTVSHTVGSVKIYGCRTGSPGNVTATIQSCTTNVPTTGKPTGVILCSGMADASAFLGWPNYRWLEIDLGSGAALAAGTMYALVISGGVNYRNHFAFRLDDSGDYAAGNRQASSDGGQTWTIWRGTDFLFEEWEISPVQAPPSITSVSPTRGAQGQALTVAIMGRYFTGATAVSLGSGVTVTSFTVDSGNQITANVAIDPLASLGARDVSVSTPAGTGALAGGFTVVQPLPIVTSVSPAEGTQGQSLAVTIAGDYFTGATAVSLGSGITVTSFAVGSANRLTADIIIAGSTSVGPRDVNVVTPGGTGTLADGFAVGVDPEAPALLREHYNTGDNSGSDIWPNKHRAQTFTPTVSHTVGSVRIYGCRTGSPGTVTATIQTCTTNVPATGKPTGVILCSGTADGNDFLGWPNYTWLEIDFGAGAPVTAGTMYAIVISGGVDSRNYFAFRLDSSGEYAAGNRQVSDDGGQTWTIYAGTDYLFEEWEISPIQAPPTITSVSPAEGTQGQSLAVTIAGGYFAGATAVSLGSGTTVTSLTVDNANQITANVTIDPLASPGVRDVSVTTPSGTGTLTNGFTVT